MINIEALELSKLNPDVDILIINMYVGDGATRVIHERIKGIQKSIVPALKSRGFTVIINPVTTTMLELGFCTTTKLIDVTTKDQINNDELFDLTREAIKAAS